MVESLSSKSNYQKCNKVISLNTHLVGFWFNFGSAEFSFSYPCSPLQLKFKRRSILFFSVDRLIFT